LWSEKVSEQKKKKNGEINIVFLYERNYQINAVSMTNLRGL